MKRKRVAARYRYKYRNNRIKPRVDKKLVLAAAASVLAVSAAGVSFWNFLQSAAPVEAQESFGGIGKVVEAHSEGEPFVILDIVPGTASYTYTLSDHSQTISIPNVSLGTIGYLTDGTVLTGEDQVSVEEGLKITFDDYQEAFYHYEEREALASLLLPAGMDASLLQPHYQEGYAGITPDLSEENGWRQIYDSYFPETGAVQKYKQNGFVHAMVQQYVEGGGADRTGFDYNLAGGTFGTNVSGGGTVYEWAGADGAYHVVFACQPEAALQGYEVVDAVQVTGEEGEYPAATGVYLLQDGIFSYAGQFQDLPDNVFFPDDEEGGTGENPVLPDVPAETPVEPENPDVTEPGPEDGDHSDSGEDNGNHGSDGSEDDGTNGPGEGNEDSGNDDTGGSGEGNEDSGSDGTDGPGEGSEDSGSDDPDGSGEGSEDGGNDDTDGSGEGSEDGGNDDPDGSGEGSGDGGNDSAGGSEDVGGAEGGDAGESTVSEPADVQEAVPSGNISDVAGLAWRKLVSVKESRYVLAQTALQPIEGDSPPDAPAGTDRPESTPTVPVNPDAAAPPAPPIPPEEEDTTGGTGETSSPETPDSADNLPSEGQNPSDTTPPADSGVSDTAPDNTTQPDAEAPSLPPTAGAKETGYYIVHFRYVSGLEEARPLYQPESVIPAEEAAVDGVPPYGTYNPVGDSAFAGDGISADDGALTGDGAYTDNGIPAASENAAEEGSEPLMTGTPADAVFVYAGAGQGEYKLEETAEEDGTGYNLLIYNAPTFFRCSGGADWLERYVFHSLAGGDNESESFRIQVKVLTASQVTPDDVMNADLVYLEAGLGELLGSGAAIHYMTEFGGDMSAEVLFNVIYRAVVDLMPVIADYGIIEADYGYMGSDAGQLPDTGQNPDAGQTPDGEQKPKMVYQKLVQILLKKNLSMYYQDMENYDNMMMNIGASKYPDKTDNHYHYVNRNIYILNDEMLVSEDFYAPFDDEKVSAGFMEVLAALKAENSTLPDEDKISEIISKARVMQYIINYSVGLISDFRDIRVLELQPTTNAHSDLKTGGGEADGYTVLYWEKEGSSGPGQQILRSSKVIDIVVDTLSVAEFSGSQRDINDRYQMVFIGLDGQRLNHERKDGIRYTVYNDGEMNGIVYSAEGDIATGDGERYDGIDITPQKREALLDFMRAGYPVVVEDDFFTGQSAKDAGVDEINTDYVDGNSQMYDFLRTAVNEYEEYLYTISDVHSSAVFAAQVNIRRPQIRYADAEENEGEEEIRLVQQIKADGEGKYRGTVQFRVEDDREEAYSDNVDIRLYLDQNQDGRFAPDEEVYSGFSTDNGEFTIEFESPQKGILPWKLEVSDAGNSYRRDALMGFFEIFDPVPTKIRILQIAPGNIDTMSDADKNEAAKYNLALAYLAADQTMMGHFLKNAEVQTGSEFEIKTISAADLEQQLAQNGKYLEGFDVLVLGFGPAENMENISWAVNQFIAQGRGVLVSSSAALGDTGRLGIDSALLGQRDTGTYGKLGQEKGDLSYYRYAPLKADMFGEKSGLAIRQVNDGSISHYPFEIGGSGRLAQPVKGADYVLNLQNNGSEDSIADVTAWYCLEDDAGADSMSAYDVSGKDAANNYYLYSRGNVIYIGEDYYAYKFEEAPGMEPPSTQDGVLECRLFVNALMAAYNVGIKNPKVAIVAGLAADAPEIESICIPFDEQMADTADGNAGLLDETTDVYFKITEPNLAFGKEVRISFYYQDDTAGTPIDIGGKSVLASPFTSSVYTVEENRLVEVGTEFRPVPGKVYQIEAPVIPLQNKSRTNADIYIVVESRFHHFGTDEPVTGSDSVVLNRAQLFLLE